MFTDAQLEPGEAVPHRDLAPEWVRFGDRRADPHAAGNCRD